MRTQLVAARAVAERLVELAIDFDAIPASGASGAAILEIAGPREESLVEAATLLSTRRGDRIRIEAWSDPDDPDRQRLENVRGVAGAREVGQETAIRGGLDASAS